MARGAHVKQEDAEPEPKASKRRCVQSACVPCRKRKSKVGNPDRLLSSWAASLRGGGALADDDNRLCGMQYGDSALTTPVRRLPSRLRNMRRSLQDAMFLRWREPHQGRWHQAR